MLDLLTPLSDGSLVCSGQEDRGVCDGGRAGCGVQGAEGCDHPTVFASVEVFVDAGNAEGTAMGVIEGEVVCAVLAFDEVGVLAHVEGAFGTGEEVTDVALNVRCY